MDACARTCKHMNGVVGGMLSSGGSGWGKVHQHNLGHGFTASFGDSPELLQQGLRTGQNLAEEQSPGTGWQTATGFSRVSEHRHMHA